MLFKVSSYLYLNHGEYHSDNWERTTIEILNRAFNEYRINSVEVRKEYKETAVNFETYIRGNSEEAAKNIFLTCIKGYDVDNYNLKIIL